MVHLVVLIRYVIPVIHGLLSGIAFPPTLFRLEWPLCFIQIANLVVGISFHLLFSLSLVHSSWMPIFYFHILTFLDLLISHDPNAFYICYNCSGNRYYYHLGLLSSILQGPYSILFCYQPSELCFWALSCYQSSLSCYQSSLSCYKVHL